MPNLGLTIGRVIENIVRVEHLRSAVAVGPFDVSLWLPVLGRM